MDLCYGSISEVISVRIHTTGEPGEEKSAVYDCLVLFDDKSTQTSQYICYNY